MSIRTNLIRLGNDNRIAELDHAGFGPCAIAGIFQDQGISISSADIASRLRTNPALESKPLRKAVVAAHIRAVNLTLKPI